MLRVTIDGGIHTSGQSRRERVRLRERAFEFDIIAVMTSSLATGLLGFLFWMVTARGYTVGEVGQASAVISSATMLATLANVSLGSMYERFLPVAGALTRRAIGWGMALSSSLALLSGVLFVLLGPRERLFDGTDQAVLFPLYVAVVAVFALQDSVLIGLRRPRQVALKNIAQSVLKLVVLAATIPLAYSASAVVAAWMVPMAVAALVVAGIVVVPRVRAAAAGAAALPPPRELWSYFTGSWAMSVVGVLVPLAVPLIIVAKLGTEANAYFNMCWLLVSTVGILVAATAAPYVAAAAGETDPSTVADLSRRFAALCLAAGTSGGLFLLAFGPLILRILGDSYSENGATLIRLIALTLPLVSVIVVFSAFARVHRKLALAAVVQWATAIAIVTGVALTTPHWGIDAVGITYLFVDIVAVCVIAVPLRRLARPLLAGAPSRTVTTVPTPAAPSTPPPCAHPATVVTPPDPRPRRPTP
ncbi:lipopolysaccharide biosynthesis protein [Rhodococcus triatomae]